MDFNTAVVGAGSAGCVVAARLAADHRHRVALIEAGRDFGEADSGRWPSELLDASRDAMDSYGWSFPGGVSATRGKVVGGCSAVNGCGILAGLDEDYDAWSKRAPGWSAAALAPYIARAEAAMRVEVTRVDDLDPWRKTFYDAALELGFEARSRFDLGGPCDAVGPIAMNAVGAMRFNAAFGYLDPVRGQANLEIVADTLADHVVFEGRRATGVAVRGPAGEHVITARRVVICAGAYASPALLVRSGVGPSRVLAELGVDPQSVLEDVAEGLRDHPLVDVPLIASPALRERCAEHVQSARPIAQVLLQRGRPGIPWELQVGPWSSDLPLEDGGIAPFGYCGITVTLTNPHSLGRVVVTSRDPAELPRVEHGFLTDGDGEDAARLRDGVALARDLAGTQAIAEVATLEPLPADLDGWIAREVGGNFHPVGTCRMGSVVDGAGRVIGVEGLRVIDASIFPALPRANTHLTVLAVAERLSEDLARESV